MAEQVRCGVTSRSRPARPGAGPDRGPEALPIAGTRPEGEGRAAGRGLLPGKRRTCRVCYMPPASAATARGDVAAGRRGRIADMTTLMLPAGLAAISSLPLAGPARHILSADYALWVDGEFAAAGRRGRAGSGACPALVFSCTGRVACGAPAGSRIRALGRERSCRWPCRAVGGRASGVAAGPRSASQPGRGDRARRSPASAAAGQRARCRRGQPGKRALLGWWSSGRCRPVATAASPCRSRQDA
jgi:hypothetical protein